MITRMSFLCCATVIFSLAALAFAGVPQTINYQGYLKDTATGAPVSGSVNMAFSLYSSNPTRNNPVWSEPAKPVTVSGGIYSTTVGSATNPITAPFDVPYYLRINVNGTDLPAQPLASVPYAQRAAVADAVPANAVNSDAISGQIHNSKLDLSTVVSKTGDTMTGALTLPTSGLSVGTNQLVVYGGNVGIGMTTPGFTLDVNGTGRVTTNFDLAAAVAQIGFNRNSTNGEIYNVASKAWQMGPIGAANNDDFVISSWNTDQSHIASVLRMTPAGNATFAGTVTAGGTIVGGSATFTGTVTAGGTIESTSGGIKFPDGTVQTTAAAPTWHQILPAAERFVLVMNNNEAVLDKETGLVWQRSTSATTYLWADAFAPCTQATIGGRKGWRLPTIEELATLVDPAQSNPALPSGHLFTNVYALGYWSSTTSTYNPDAAQSVIFYDGYVSNSGKFSTFYIRCVRGGQ